MKDSGGEGLMKFFGFLTILALIPIMYIINGFIIVDMWEWFVLPIFVTLPALTTGQAIGLGVITGYMCKYHKIWEPKEEKEAGAGFKFAMGIILPFFVWLNAWIVHLCIS